MRVVTYLKYREILGLKHSIFLSQLDKTLKIPLFRRLLFAIFGFSEKIVATAGMVLSWANGGKIATLFKPSGTKDRASPKNMMFKLSI